MKWYFEHPERRERLLAEMESWRGTPFHKYARVKGAGVDCVHLAGALYIATGLLKEFTPPPYNFDHGQHHSESLVERYVRDTGRFEALPATVEWMPGDLLCFALPGALTTHHVGVAVRPKHFLHAMGRVDELRCLGPWKSGVKAVYRPVEGCELHKCELHGIEEGRVS